MLYSIEKKLWGWLKVLRNLIEIDEIKCNGCGLCIPNCHEGALKIVDGKAKLVSEVYCDGLGNCLGHCPKGAIKIVKKEVKAFDFKKTNLHLKKIGRKELKENPLKEEKTMEKKLPCGCPGTMAREINQTRSVKKDFKQVSQLKQWPVQLSLLPHNASFFDGAHLLVSADCVPFATANFHSRLLVGKTVLIGCPKLDDVEAYKEKLIEIFKSNKVKSITVAIMEVPCCYGLASLVEEALKKSGKSIPLIKEVVSVSGDIQ
ncbi:MAG: 4Fe-4S dicluster domain-containing protein [archaeon]